MNITITGVESALERIKKLPDADELARRITQRLCKDFAEPIVSEAHSGHAEVNTVPLDDGYETYASGDDVLFVEFGAGNAAGAEAGNYTDVPSVVYPGSWSETHARQYVMYGNWWFGNQAYVEVVPNPSFYRAYEAVKMNLPKVAAEEISK